jgi:hypothetical protein
VFTLSVLSVAFSHLRQKDRKNTLINEARALLSFVAH